MYVLHALLQWAVHGCKTNLQATLQTVQYNAYITIHTLAFPADSYYECADPANIVF